MRKRKRGYEDRQTATASCSSCRSDAAAAAAALPCSGVSSWGDIDHPLTLHRPPSLLSLPHTNVQTTVHSWGTSSSISSLSGMLLFFPFEIRTTFRSDKLFPRRTCSRKNQSIPCLSMNCVPLDFPFSCVVCSTKYYHQVRTGSRVERKILASRGRISQLYPAREFLADRVSKIEYSLAWSRANLQNAS
ncbi:hypothetical protein BP00DRAFT_102745 [Aspergillus indologenus CBS 114.80]|uniref:Uncharacterized protein n=1 Tax=Aspergillus indologenus CBS 114.80 TaxID=1450541 RepID=A0A2V5HUW2_9EURO|nr:hypothetical protein BP00DRAFT_102745 [Aspergillus indologenus CBS 114.80]